MTVDAAYKLYAASADADSLNTLFNAITHYASRLASMKLDAADREDAAQEAVVYVWQKLSMFDAKRGRFAPWCCRQILASFLAYRRRQHSLKRGNGWIHVEFNPAEIEIHILS